MKVLRLRGTPYENGKISGNFFKKVIKKDIPFYENLLNNFEIKQSTNSLLLKLKDKYPDYYEEIKGKADGAEVNFQAYFLMMCPELFEKIDHCTTIICKDKGGKFILSHNEDDNYTKNNFCLSKVYTKDGWFATNDIFNMPFGNGYSWNSFGIIKTINYCYDPFPKLDNFSRYFAQRHISEAKTIDDLINRCEELKPASGFHVNALDINKNIAVSIEVFCDSVDIKFIDDSFIHSNHFLRGNFATKTALEENSNSKFRLAKATELLNKTKIKNIKKIYNILMYRSKEDAFETSIFQTEKDPYLTGTNFSCLVNDKNHIYITDFVNKEKYKIPYDL